MLPNIWRSLVTFADWRQYLRSIRGTPRIDVVCISNLRDEVDKQRYRGRCVDPQGHFAGAKFWIDGIAGQTRGIDTTTDELLTAHGRKKAKEQFISATQWASQNGAKVVLLAAATKRLFGRDGAELKRMFPDILFTIGDNGTVVLLLSEIQYTIEKLLKRDSRIAVLGPYGYLGEQVTKYLSERGYTVLGVGPNVAGLKRVQVTYGIPTYKGLEEIKEVDAVVACTHSKVVRLDAQLANHIRRKSKRLVVLDVAEPPNLTNAEYNNCKNTVIRQDVGNAYSPRLKYVLGAFSYRMFRLSRGVTFGCFAEAMSLAAGLRKEEKIKSMDWFEVTNSNQQTVNRLFASCGFRTPSPRCFGMTIKDFNLNVSGGICSDSITGTVRQERQWT